MAERKPDAQCANTGPSNSPSGLGHPVDHAIAEHLALDRRDVAKAQACGLGQFSLLGR